MPSGQVLSHTTTVALRLLGAEVAVGRRERRWTASELAERAGVSLNTLRKVERGDPTVSLGTAFEVANLVGISLWGGPEEASRRLTERRDRATLLPQRVRTDVKDIDDDF